MKNFLFIVLLGVVSYLDANSQIDSIPVRLAGRVESVDSAFQLPYVHIINKRTGLGVISDSVGVFKTTLFPADTLILRCLGFNDFHYNLPDTLQSNFFFISLKMAPTSYQIRVVDVFALTPKRQFRYDFINMPIKEEDWPNQDFYIQGVNNPNYRKLREAEKSIYPTYIGGPLAFAYKMTQRSKSYEKLAQLVKEDKWHKEDKDKYSLKILEEISGFAGDTLLAFYIFLDFSPGYIHKMHEYDLYVKILQSISPFKEHFKKNGSPVNFLND